MEPTHVTCTRVEEEDLDARYLAGTLSEEEAEAFEEHYFGCDRCWTAVQTGLDVRAASAATTDEPRVQTSALTIGAGGQPRAASFTRRRWFPVAIAASVAIIAVAVWQSGTRSPVTPVGDGLRGSADSLYAVAFIRGQTLGVSWTPSPTADLYGVRLQTSDATVILERMVSDTSLAVSRDSLSVVTSGERVYWEVRALDALRRTIARSRLIPTQVPDGRR